MSWEPVGRVQISTMCVNKGLVVAGGFHGEMACKRLDSHEFLYTGRITNDDNAITNAIEIFESPRCATPDSSPLCHSAIRCYFDILLLFQR